MIRPIRSFVSLLSLAALLVCVSCGNDDAALGGGAGAAGAQPVAGQSGAGGAPGSPTAGGSSSAGTAASPSLGGAGGAPNACYGDAAKWSAVTAAPPECDTAEDCCVVINWCLAAAQIVHTRDFRTAQTAWPYCDDECSDCIPPAVTVTCDNGHCAGVSDPDSVEEGVSHCGDSPPAGGAPAQAFSCQ